MLLISTGLIDCGTMRNVIKYGETDSDRHDQGLVEDCFTFKVGEAELFLHLTVGSIFLSVFVSSTDHRHLHSWSSYGCLHRHILPLRQRRWARKMVLLSRNSSSHYLHFISARSCSHQTNDDCCWGPVCLSTSPWHSVVHSARIHLRCLLWALLRIHLHRSLFASWDVKTRKSRRRISKLSCLGWPFINYVSYIFKSLAYPKTTNFVEI